MNLTCQRIKILEQQPRTYLVKFLDSNIAMPVSRTVVDSKIKNGFYEVVT